MRSSDVWLCALQILGAVAFLWTSNLTGAFGMMLLLILTCTDAICCAIKARKP